MRENAALEDQIRKIEGPHVIYDYLKNLPEMNRRGMNPLVVDCLNCELGCNGGPGTLNREKSPDEVEYYVRKRRDEMQARHSKGAIGIPNYKKKINRSIDDYWKPKLYHRAYQNRSSSYNLQTLSNADLESIYRSMHKYTEDDFYNCTACGYNTCEGHAQVEHNQSAFAQISDELHEQIKKSTELIAKIDISIESVMQRSHDQQSSLEESSASIEEMVSSIASAAKVTSERKSTMDNLIVGARKGQGDLRQTIDRIEAITGSVRGIGSMIEVIDDVAAHTNLLAINAAIEAAHAGDTGRGFSVVADEIRKLAEQTAVNASTISLSLTEMINDIGDVANRSQQTGGAVDGIISDVRNLAESLAIVGNSMDELSTGSTQITEALSHLNNISTEVQEAYREIGESIRSMRGIMETMNDVSNRSINTLQSSVIS